MSTHTSAQTDAGRLAVSMTGTQTQTNTAFDTTLSSLLAPLPGEQQKPRRHPLPCWNETAALLENLRILLLLSPDPEDARQLLLDALTTLRSQLALCTQADSASGSSTVSSDDFLLQLPRIRQSLQEDIETYLKNDPAVTS